MAVNGTIQLAYQDTAWFAANPTIVLLEGQHVYLSDGADEFLSAYVVGDGVTELQDLPWKGLSNTVGTQDLQDVINESPKVDGVLAESLDGQSNVSVENDLVALNSTNGTENSQVAVNSTSVTSQVNSTAQTITDGQIENTTSLMTYNSVEVATINDIPSLSGYLTSATAASTYATISNLDLKLPIQATQTTGVTLTFLTDSVYGTIGTPETGNINYSATNAKLGVTNLIIHNSGTLPIFATNMKESTGSLGYSLSVINYIWVTYINSTEVLYRIEQRA